MKICIIGKNSYIGNHLDQWLNRYGYTITQLDVLSENWKCRDYSVYDVIIHVAGIVHQPNCQDEELYRSVNTEMPVYIAEKFKSCRQSKSVFIFLSTMAVYGTPKRLRKNVVTNETPTNPLGLYAKSKLAAEERLLPLQDENFDVVIVRPPNVYGKGCRGGYIPGFVNVVKKIPAIPVAYSDVKQSMLYIDNLCEFIRLVIEQKRYGIFMPQDDCAVSAVDICTSIAKGLGKKPRVSYLMGIFIRLFNFIPLIQKAYGGVEYDSRLSQIEGMNYVLVPFNEAMIKTIK